MKLKAVKTEADALNAVQSGGYDRPLVEITSRDGTIRAVRIGGLHIGGSYGIEVSREVPHEVETRHRVTAKAQGFEPRVEYFDEYYKADEFRGSFTAGAEVSLDENVKVLVDASGRIVCEAEPVTSGDATSDELTF
jgi:hypothetical protein